MIKVKLHPKVSDEIKEAYLWYDKKSKGLGQKFLNEIDEGINFITDFPEACSIYFEGVRRFLLQKFPFAIVYQKRGSTIVIIAVMHLKRKPDYWKNRI